MPCRTWLSAWRGKVSKGPLLSAVPSKSGFLRACTRKLSPGLQKTFSTTGDSYALAVGRLKQGIGLSQAEASLKTIASRLEKEFPKDNAGRSIALTPLTEAAVGANLHDQIALAGTMMMTVVGLVLLIACANLANLLLARAARREREMGLRDRKSVV